MNSVDEQKYFKLIGDAWEKSKIKQEHPGWGWSLAATQLYKNSLVIVGLNWGATKGEEEKPQSSLCQTPWMQQKDLGSLESIKHYLNTYFQDDLGSVVQTNYCFFRTPGEKEIHNDDLNRCHDIFMDLISDLQPKRILILSAKVRDRIKIPGLVEQPFSSNGRSVIAMRGYWRINDRQTPIGMVPHPQARISNEARRKCWEWATGRI